MICALIVVSCDGRFIVDNIPIRVFKNIMAQGVAYPNIPMHIEASIWNAPVSWAGPVDWSQAPFIAHCRDFGFYACLAKGYNVLPNNVSAACDSDKYFWNRQKYRQLNATQQQQMAYYRKNYMINL